VLGGLTTISAERVNPGVFERHGKVQKVVVGEFEDSALPTSNEGRSDRVRDIAKAFQKAGVETLVSNDIHTELWRKFAFLAAVAAVCGLTRAAIGPVRSTSMGRVILERAVREVIDVGEARGIRFADNEVSRIMNFCDSLPETNKPSLLRDLEAGRTTEVEDLSGAVSRMARMAGIDTPIHDTAAVAISLASSAR
jgi:2-dehydropantoate 2-reductase